MNHKITIATLTALLTALTVKAQFTPGNLLVYRVGANTGTDTLANTGNAVFIDEWTTTGTYVKSVSTGVFASGTATSEGLLNASPDGKYVAFTGYASSGATSIVSSASTANNRIVGVINSTGIASKTNFSDFATGNNPRSAVTTNGTDLWMAGGAGGLRYGTVSASVSTSTQVSTTVTNVRSVEAFGNQLYVSTSSGSAVRVGTVGTGFPTTTGNTITNLPGFLTAGSPYEYVLADLTSSVAGFDTLYVAEDTTSSGLIQKFSLVSGNWTASGTVTAAGVRGLTAKITGTTVSLFASGSAGSGGTVYSFTDSTGYNATVSGTATSLFTQANLQTALSGTGSNYAFRGIEFAPVAAIPEPSTYAAILGGVALLGVAARRRRSA
jgi:hypothetical protein